MVQVANIVANEFGKTFNRNVDLIDDMSFVTDTKIDGRQVLKQIVLDGECIPAA